MLATSRNARSRRRGEAFTLKRRPCHWYPKACWVPRPAAEWLDAYEADATPPPDVPAAHRAGPGHVQAAGGLRVRLEGEPVAGAVAEAAAGHRVVGAGKRFATILAAHLAGLERPVAQPALQQLARVVQGKGEGAALAVDVRHHQLCLAGAAEDGGAVDPELPRAHLLLGLADAVDEQVHGRGQGRFAGERCQRHRHPVGLQAEVARDADATEARGAGPVELAADAVADADADHPLREVELPGGVQAHVGRRGFRPVAGAQHAAAAPHPGAGAEQAQFVPVAQRAGVAVALGEDVVVEQQARRARSADSVGAGGGT